MDFLTTHTHRTYKDHLRERFGEKTYKIVVSSGLTCPTRDGTLAKRGCAFCDVRGSSSFFGKIGRGKKIQDQLAARIPGIAMRFGAKKFIAYFQSYTNTYSDTEYLREIYSAALSHPQIEGLAVGTRPDCLPDEVLLLLQELSQKHYVCLELGVQSFENATLDWFKRGHTSEQALEAFARAQRLAPNVELSVHLIFGNPTDPIETPIRAAEILNRAPIHGVKLHQLMVLKGTELAEWYMEKPFPLPSLEEYAEIVGQFLNHLRPDIYVERLCATATHPDECLAPEWSRGRWEPHNEIRKWIAQKNLAQPMISDAPKI